MLLFAVGGCIFEPIVNDVDGLEAFHPSSNLKMPLMIKIKDEEQNWREKEREK